MLKSLRTRLEKIEAARHEGVFEVLRGYPDGGGSLTAIRRSRVVARRTLDADEAARWRSRPHVVIERSYVHAG